MGYRVSGYWYLVFIQFHVYQVLEATLRCSEPGEEEEKSSSAAEGEEPVLVWQPAWARDPGGSFAAAALETLGRLAQSCPRVPLRAPLTQRRPHSPADF